MQESYKPKLVRYIHFISQYDSSEGLEFFDILKNAQNKERYFCYFVECSDKNAITVKSLLRKEQKRCGSKGLNR
jgi:hypothetical protein